MNKEEAFMLKYARDFIAARYSYLQSVADHMHNKTNLFTIMDTFLDQISTRSGPFAGYPKQICEYHAQNYLKIANELGKHMLTLLKYGMENNQNLFTYNLSTASFDSLTEALHNTTCMLKPDLESYVKEFESLSADDANVRGVTASRDVVLANITTEIGYAQQAAEYMLSKMSKSDYATALVPGFEQHTYEGEKLNKLAGLVKNIKTMYGYKEVINDLAREKIAQLNGDQPSSN